jgi:hypothetical protein
MCAAHNKKFSYFSVIFFFFGGGGVCRNNRPVRFVWGPLFVLCAAEMSVSWQHCCCYIKKVSANGALYVHARQLSRCVRASVLTILMYTVYYP